MGPVEASPIFNTYDLSTVDALTETAVAVVPLENFIKVFVMKYVRQLLLTI